MAHGVNISPVLKPHHQGAATATGCSSPPSSCTSQRAAESTVAAATMITSRKALSSSSGGGNEHKTGIGSRRIFPPQFKLQVLDSYRRDADCKGNQRATARKYGIHRRQIQKWLQVECNLRNSVISNSTAKMCAVSSTSPSLQHDQTSSNDSNNNHQGGQKYGAGSGSGTAVPPPSSLSSTASSLHQNNHNHHKNAVSAVATMSSMAAAQAVQCHRRALDREPPLLSQSCAPTALKLPRRSSSNSTSASSGDDIDQQHRDAQRDDAAPSSTYHLSYSTAGSAASTTTAAVQRVGGEGMADTVQPHGHHNHEYVLLQGSDYVTAAAAMALYDTRRQHGCGAVSGAGATRGDEQQTRVPSPDAAAADGGPLSSASSSYSSSSFSSAASSSSAVSMRSSPQHCYSPSSNNDAAQNAPIACGGGASPLDFSSRTLSDHSNFSEGHQVLYYHHQHAAILSSRLAPAVTVAHDGDKNCSITSAYTLSHLLPNHTECHHHHQHHPSLSSSPRPGDIIVVDDVTTSSSSSSSLPIDLTVRRCSPRHSYSSSCVTHSTSSTSGIPSHELRAAHAHSPDPEIWDLSMRRRSGDNNDSRKRRHEDRDDEDEAMANKPVKLFKPYLENNSDNDDDDHDNNAHRAATAQCATTLPPAFYPVASYQPPYYAGLYGASGYDLIYAHAPPPLSCFVPPPPPQMESIAGYRVEDLKLGAIADRYQRRHLARWSRSDDVGTALAPHGSPELPAAAHAQHVSIES